MQAELGQCIQDQLAQFVVPARGERAAHEIEHHTQLAHAAHGGEGGALGVARQFLELALFGQDALGQLDLADQFAGIERLADEVLATGIIAGQAGFDVVKPRNEGDRDIGGVEIGLDVPAQVQPIHARQADVEQEHVGVFAVQMGNAGFGVDERHHVTFFGQHHLEQFPQQGIVLDHEYLEIGLHRLTLLYVHQHFCMQMISPAQAHYSRFCSLGRKYHEARLTNPVGLPERPTRLW